MHEDIESLVVFEHFFRHSVLIRVQVAIFAVLHDEENGLCFYIKIFLQANVFISFTMLGCLREYIELISWDKYFSRDGFLFNCLRVMHLMASGRNYLEMELPR